MPMMVTKTQVGVHRDGKTVRPKIGEAFDFTDEEVAHFGSEHLRRPRNEVVMPEVTSAEAVSSDDDEDESQTASRAARAAKTARKGRAVRASAAADDDDDSL